MYGELWSILDETIRLCPYCMGGRAAQLSSTFVPVTWSAHTMGLCGGNKCSVTNWALCGVFNFHLCWSGQQQYHFHKNPGIAKESKPYFMRDTDHKLTWSRGVLTNHVYVWKYINFEIEIKKKHDENQRVTSWNLCWCMAGSIEAEWRIYASVN